MFSSVALPVLVALYPSLAAAYSFDITSTPRQCQTFGVSISGSGSPPYSLLVIPYGASPLPNNIEARRIVQQNFTGSSTSFQLKYPTNSHFVAVMSDSSGFGSGGTSVAGTVLESSDSSCYDASTNVQPDWTYKIDPPNQLVQCQAARLWWDQGDPQGNPAFFGVIPGGESFAIPLGTTSDIVGTGRGFNWTPPIRGGTEVILTAGDDRGFGVGGSVTFTVGSGTSNNGSCLSSSSPSSTPGTPAGGSYPTSTSGAGTGDGNTSSGGGGGSSTDVGAIVGGVVGGVVGAIVLCFLALFFYRRRRFHKRTVDLLNEDPADGPTTETQQAYYRPEPFVLPDPTEVSSVGAAESRGTHLGSRRDSATSLGATSTLPPPTALASSRATGKSGRAPSLRPVNVVQHEDAGPPPPPEVEPEQEPETVELPPAYTNIRR
ncbi:hypothetical protein NEOLEDRAFT_1069029 [Neolentinus lepideus HHB14362 ss-1]|uniref:Mid2 domain-containing protein n=1 Tax=Neolentinus lepideus HHB14362 ss-1 TaxID=1314782 RepID=A0A165RDE0_9AGAM|nr:hypothetical protein NEOLEDRAFT_1069029 [Neolentinus lepideus HHB14362 ss-1]